MNWDAIGAIGEIVGALAVVITLAYLARQTRDNTKVARAASRQAISTMNVQTWGVSLDSAVLSRAATKVAQAALAGIDDAGLEPDEEFNYRRWILMRMRLIENAYYQYERGLLDRDEWEGYRRLTRGLLQGYGAQAWEAGKTAYSPRFTEAVDAILRELDPVGYG